MKIVFDTNCLLRVLPQKSNYRCLWDSFLRGEFELCYSTEILQEYEEVLSRFYFMKIAESAIGALLKSPNSIQTIPYYKWHLITADPDDNKFVDCALNAGADFIVSNDKHFNVLKKIEFPKINVIDIDTLKEIISV
jgi:putative PIN family toxin of toxin-antitoxin system